MKIKKNDIVKILAGRDSGKTAKVLSWYDNEWGFSNRMVELAAKMF